MAKLRIDPFAYIWAAVLLYLLPFRWLVSAAAAAIIHELCHLLALKMLGFGVTEIRIGFRGAVIRTEHMAPREEIICALAGPAGSILLASLYRYAPEMALCAFIHGVFNLLPVYPLDGGRAVRCLVYSISKRPEQTAETVECCILAVVFLMILILCIVFHLGIYPCVILAAMVGKGFLRKIPCKPGRQALQ